MAFAATADRPQRDAWHPGLGERRSRTCAVPQQDALAALHQLLEAPKRLCERTGICGLVAYDELQEMLAAQPDLDGVLRSHIQHHTGAVSWIFSPAATRA